VTPTLTAAHHIPQETIVKYAVFHVLDRLPLADKLILITKLYGPMKSALGIENLMKEYFDGKKIENQGNVGMLLSNGETWEIYKRAQMEWVAAEPVERESFIRVGLMRFVVRHANIHTVIGFMNEFKNEVEFKMKDMTQTRNNRGSKCDNEIKSDVLKRLNLVLGEETYTLANSENIEKAGLCVILEMLCRYFNETKRNGKVWFMDTEQALINQISTLKLK